MTQLINTIETEDYKVAYSNKISLSSNYDIQIVESKNLSPSSNVINTKQTTGFKIKSIGDKPLKTIAIFMTQKDSFVGFISANIYKDNTASLIMSSINYTPLPENLDELRQYLLQTKHQDVAIYVDENYQGQGIGKRLINLMLGYLSAQGITDVKVVGIKDERALRTYLSTGAIQTSNKTAIYQNINQVTDNQEPKHKSM